MKKIVRIIGIVLFTLPILVLIAGQVGLLHGKRPADLGAPNHVLKPPGATSENVVSSQAARHPHTDYHLIAPLKFTGDPVEAFGRLQKIVVDSEGATIISVQPNYLYAEFQSKILKFVDDVEFVMDAPKGEIHMRSASRLGRKDFGANRTRLEKIRVAFEKK
jgi:uncharacterized protein (DUF1499 family)